MTYSTVISKCNSVIRTSGLISPNSKNRARNGLIVEFLVCFEHLVTIPLDTQYNWLYKIHENTAWLKQWCLASNSVWDRIEIPEQNITSETTVIPHYYSATIIDRFIRSPVEFRLFLFNLSPNTYHWQLEFLFQAELLAGQDCLIKLYLHVFSTVSYTEYQTDSGSTNGQIIDEKSNLREGG